MFFLLFASIKPTRWFNHISAAAEAYKQRTKNNHDIVTSIEEDPSSVTIPSGTAKETADQEFIASTANLTLNVSNASATTEGTPSHNQSMDGQRGDPAHHSTSHDNEAFERMYKWDMRICKTIERNGF